MQGLKVREFPAIVQITTRLTDNYEIHIYSHSFIYKKENNIAYHYAPQWIRFSFARWIYVIASLLFSQCFKKKYDLLFSFWGYPSGAIAVVLGKIVNRPSIVFLLGG